MTIVGGRTSAVRQLGNAVPSLLGEVMGRALLEQAFGITPASERPTLLPPRRRPVPPPRAPEPVPAAYLHLAGCHEAHPGTGKGYARARRAAA